MHIILIKIIIKYYLIEENIFLLLIAYVLYLLNQIEFYYLIFYYLMKYKDLKILFKILLIHFVKKRMYFIVKSKCISK